MCFRQYRDRKLNLPLKTEVVDRTCTFKEFTRQFVSFTFHEMQLTLRSTPLVFDERFRRSRSISRPLRSVLTRSITDNRPDLEVKLPSQTPNTMFL